MAGISMSKPGESTRIVIADDHPVLRASLTALLHTQADFQVVGTAGSGRETVTVVERERPDILLLDLFMPEGDGFEVLRRLERAKQQVSSVVLTASESRWDYAQVVKLGARGLVLKADSPQRLFAAIRTVASGELAFASDITDQVVHTMAREPRREPGNLSRLSERERQIAALVVRGLRNKDVAAELHISENTVKRHLQSIFNKTGIRDRLELAVLAISEISQAA